MDVFLVRYSDRDRMSLARSCAVYLNKTDFDNVKRPLSLVKHGHWAVFRGEHVRFMFRTSLVVRDHLFRYSTANMIAAAGLRANHADEWVSPLDEPSLLQKVDITQDELLEPYHIALDAGVKPQDARYLAPMGTEVDYMMEFNFLTLMQAVFPQRLWTPGAQAETKCVVERMWHLVMAEDPEFWTVVREELGEEAIMWSKVRQKIKKKHPDLYQDVLHHANIKSMWD